MKLKIGIIASSGALSSLITTFNNTLKFLFSSTNTNLYNYDETEFESQEFASINDIEYVAVPDNINTATTWTTRTSNFGNTTIASVAYGNNLWVAGGYYGTLRSSTDGTIWTTITSNFGSSNINSITYANNLWVAGGYAGQIRTSPQIYSSTKYLASGNQGIILSSTDLTTWTTITSPTTKNINFIKYNGDKYIMGVDNV